MEYTIQKIVFPLEQKHNECRELFFRGWHSDNSEIKNNEGLSISDKQTVDFTTYLNGCSYGKWKQYTSAKNLKIYLNLQGLCSVSFVGYAFTDGKLLKLEYSTVKHDSKELETLLFAYPENDSTVLINGFEISAESKCLFYGGHYSVDVAEEKCNKVELALALTTFHKEEFIRKNIEVIKKSTLNTCDEAAEHIFLHIIDNGGTLTNEEVSGKNVFLHHNINTGGAGGFARGMIESLHQKQKATNVLLMDDDVLVLGESIRRTYYLLKLLRDEFKGSFISGAMLVYEEPYLQYADVEDASKYGVPVKDELNLKYINQLAENEKNYCCNPELYAPWWYCVIPSSSIEKYGLPLPIFIHADDMEFSLRNRATFITMNGICVWHMSFSRKYSASLNEYYHYRNLLIAKASSDILRKNDIEKIVYRRFRMNILSFNYNVSELLLDAYDDYIKGPGFLKDNNPENILYNKNRLNNHFEKIEIDDESCDLEKLYKDSPRRFLKKVLYRLTWNGQLLFPERFLNNEPAVIPFNAAYLPGKISFKRYHLLVNPYEKTGKMLELDKKRFKSLMKRYSKLRIYYLFNRDRIMKDYRNARAELTSEQFWRKYLKLSQTEKDI